MNLNTSLFTIGGLTTVLGLGNIWDILAASLSLPPNFITLPSWMKVLVVAAAIIGAVTSAYQTSITNPDGTPATERYSPE